MNRIGIICFAMITGLVITVAGCKKGGTPEEKAAEEMKKAEPKYDNTLPGKEGVMNAIKGYNQAVIHAQRKEAYGKFVGKYASKREASRVIVFVQEDRSKERVMRSRLDKLVFKNISTSDEVTIADTEENWEFDYVDLNTGKMREPVRGMEYKLRYKLIRDGDRWLVGKIEELEPPMVKSYSPPRALEP